MIQRVISRLQILGDTAQTNLAGTLTVTTADNTDDDTITVVTGVGATGTVTTASAANSDTVTIDATALANDVNLTINGGGAGAAGTISITNFIGNLVTTNASSGAIAKLGR